MNITIKDWKELDRIRKTVQKAIEIADSQSFEIFCKYRVGNSSTPENKLLLEINEKYHELRELAGFLHDTHLQSEWLVGNFDNPKNHTLREPNCCPMPRKRFSAEEIEAANLINLSHCQ